jgi:hypothetical protein
MPVDTELSLSRHTANPAITSTAIEIIDSESKTGPHNRENGENGILRNTRRISQYTERSEPEAW